jgi:hypothetical protein
MTTALAPFAVTITCLRCKARFEATIDDELPVLHRSEEAPYEWWVTVAADELHRCAEL